MVRKMAEETNCQGIHIVKILFLDMDGVVNKGRDNASPNRYRYNDKWSNPSDRFDLLYYVDPELAARVSALVADFDLRIVSTSTWRCGKTVDEFKELLNNRFLPGDRLIGFTPDGESEGMSRADEIRYFLLHCEENIERYVILDDEKKANYCTPKGRFFQTSFYKGYTEKVDTRIREYLENR